MFFTDASIANHGSITAYSWGFGDSTGSSAEQNLIYTYTKAGTFGDIEGETTATNTQSER